MADMIRYKSENDYNNNNNINNQNYIKIDNIMINRTVIYAIGENEINGNYRGSESEIGLN